MVLLIDTNIVLDVLLNRSEFVKDSSMVWKLCETEQAKGYLSTLTYANMMYVMRKQLTPDQIDRCGGKRGGNRETDGRKSGFSTVCFSNES